LHFVAELDPRSWRGQDAIRAELCARVQRTFGLRVEGVALVPPGSIPRTSSGKLKRRACRDSYLRGEYDRSVGLRTRFAFKLAQLGQLISARRPATEQAGAEG
jgi:acyl-CoA synthetase (AMP-forming)/AMP-acid ligase II